ncbi:MAG: phosphoribosyltransferase family protein [Fimbriimonadaceae bacterium]
MAGRSWLDAVLDWVYAPKCGLCGVADRPAVCGFCESEFERGPIDPIEPAAELGLDALVWAYSYRGRASQAVRRLKYDRVTSLARPMAAHVRRVAAECSLDGADLVVPVPIHWSRRFHRGFNQSELLCREFPVDRVRPGAVARVRPTRPQASLSPAERRRNLAGAFVADRAIEGASVLLIDDVVTSGTTLSECARACREAGAASVSAVAFAGTWEVADAG